MPMMMPVVDVLPCSSVTQSHGVSSTGEGQHSSVTQRHAASHGDRHHSASSSVPDTRTRAEALTLDTLMQCRIVCGYSKRWLVSDAHRISPRPLAARQSAGWSYCLRAGCMPAVLPRRPAWDLKDSKGRGKYLIVSETQGREYNLKVPYY